MAGHNNKSVYKVYTTIEYSRENQKLQHERDTLAGTLATIFDNLPHLERSFIAGILSRMEVGDSHNWTDNLLVIRTQ